MSSEEEVIEIIEEVIEEEEDEEYAWEDEDDESNEHEQVEITITEEHIEMDQDELDKLLTNNKKINPNNTDSNNEQENDVIINENDQNIEENEVKNLQNTCSDDNTSSNEKAEHSNDRKKETEKEKSDNKEKPKKKRKKKAKGTHDRDSKSKKKRKKRKKETKNTDVNEKVEDSTNKSDNKTTKNILTDVAITPITISSAVPSRLTPTVPIRKQAVMQWKEHEALKVGFLQRYITYDLTTKNPKGVVLPTPKPEWVKEWVHLDKYFLSFFIDKDCSKPPHLRAPLNVSKVSNIIVDSEHPHPYFTMASFGGQNEICIGSTDKQALEEWHDVISKQRRKTMTPKKVKKFALPASMPSSPVTKRNFDHLMDSERLSTGSGFTKDIRRAIRKSMIASELFALPTESVCDQCKKTGPIFGDEATAERSSSDTSNTSSTNAKLCLDCKGKESADKSSIFLPARPTQISHRDKMKSRRNARKAMIFNSSAAIETMATSVAKPNSNPSITRSTELPNQADNLGNINLKQRSVTLSALVRKPREKFDSGNLGISGLPQKNWYNKAKKRILHKMNKKDMAFEVSMPTYVANAKPTPESDPIVKEQKRILEVQRRRGLILMSQNQPTSRPSSTTTKELIESNNDDSTQAPNNDEKDSTETTTNVTKNESGGDDDGNGDDELVLSDTELNFDSDEGLDITNLSTFDGAAAAYNMISDDEFAFSSDEETIPTKSSSEICNQHTNSNDALHGEEEEEDDDEDEEAFYESDDEAEDATGDWNQRFQTIMESMREKGSMHEEISKNLALIGLAQDFLYSATSYGKIIISEVYLPDHEKTIKPANVGGVAGGSKYIAQNILFKFALDTGGLYGNDDSIAAKVAGHELKGLQAYFNCNIRGLSLPVMALVDYRGFRLIAISLLPLDSNTIVYGSNDGGQTIHDENAKMRGMMNHASNILNIQSHMAGLHPEKRKLLHSAADIEGHKGLDGRFYLIDFSRTFPCQPPDREIKGSNLSRLFRPEFVKSYPQPLCSDAFSGFCSSEFNQDSKDAMKYLEQTVIPEVGDELPSLIEKAGGSMASFRLTEVVHSRGINVALLGHVLSAVHNSSSSAPIYKKIAIALIFIEMVARVVKNKLRLQLRKRMKKLKKPLEEPYRKLVIDYLNLVFGNKPKTDQYWDVVLKKTLMDTFEGFSICHFRSSIFSISNPGSHDSKTLTLKSIFDQYTKVLQSHYKNDYIHLKALLLFRVQKMMGFILSPQAVKDLTSNINGKLDAIKPITRTDLVAIGDRIKHMNIISHAEGYLLTVKGMQCRANNPESAIASFEKAIEKFEEVLNSNTNSKVTLKHCAKALLLLDEEFRRTNKEVFDKNRPLVVRAKKYLLRALEIDKRDTQTLCQLAQFLQECCQLKEAEEYYLQALEYDPTDAEAMRAYGSLLEEQGEFDAAEQFFIRITQRADYKF